MAVILEDRPIEQIREEVIDTLIYNYSHGVISNEAFERRLDEAMASQDHQEIFNLAADLEKTTDSEFTSQKERQFNVNYAASNNDDTDDTDTIVNIFGAWRGAMGKRGFKRVAMMLGSGRQETNCSFKV